MSYLHVPRICIEGRFEAGGVTANNVLAALNDVNKPGFDPTKNLWHNNNFASNQFTISGALSQVVSAWDADASVKSDPVLGATVSGDGVMADLDPEHRRVTELIGLELAIRMAIAEESVKLRASPFSAKRRLSPPAAQPDSLLKGTLRTTQLRDYWEPEPKSPFVSAVWQSVLCGLTWSSDLGGSKVFRDLHQVSPAGLSVRLVTASYDGRGGKLLAVIGPHHDGEPEQIAPGRRLVPPDAKLPYGGFPAASFLVDERRHKLVVDLGNLIAPSFEPTAGFLTGLTAKVGGQAVGNPRDLTVCDWLKSAGLVEWDLTMKEQDLLAHSPLQLEFSRDGKSSNMSEQTDGKYVDVDRRSLRLNPGDCVTVPVYARRFGLPLSGEVVCFNLKKQAALDPLLSLWFDPCQPSDPYFPSDPKALINGEPANVFDPPPPFSVKTDADGRAELRLKIKPGPFKFPPERNLINSQLYFLGDPDGWQRWGALGPEVGKGCALSVLVFNKRRDIANPTWNDVSDILARYARLYPFMRQVIDLSDEDAVRTNALRIRQRLTACVDAIEHMPVTRDLSAYDRGLIVKYLDSVIQTHQGLSLKPRQPSPRGSPQESQKKNQE